jgi:hypothetical protein
MRRRIAGGLAIVVLLYLAGAYLAAPDLWRHYEHAPDMAPLPKRTVTADGIPGDAINVGLVGSEEDVLRAMHAARWSPADPITLASSARIALSVLLDRPDPDAPVSPLFYDGPKQDLAFEKPVGKSAKERHHVRFWKQPQQPRPLWLGAVTFDRAVGLSHTTGQITHHIGPDIDAERDGLIADLRAAGVVTTQYNVTGIGPTWDARNGGGDPFYTDGEITIAVLTADAQRSAQPAEVLPSPPLIQAKDGIWSLLRRLRE